MELQLSTLDQVLLIITTSAITLFFLLGVAMLIVGLVLVSKIKKVVAKAEDAIDSVEAATETIKNIGAQAGGPLAIFKIIKSVYDVVNRKK
jgi:predicted MFS family arabinose efflux permease